MTSHVDERRLWLRKVWRASGRTFPYLTRVCLCVCSGTHDTKSPPYHLAPALVDDGARLRRRAVDVVSVHLLRGRVSPPPPPRVPSSVADSSVVAAHSPFCFLVEGFIPQRDKSR